MTLIRCKILYGNVQCFCGNTTVLLSLWIKIANFIRNNARVLLFSSAPLFASSAFTHSTYTNSLRLKKYSSKVTTTFKIDNAKNLHENLSFLLKDKPPKSTKELLSKEEMDFINALVQRRSNARAVGDYTFADSLRDEIVAISRVSEGGYGQVSIPVGYKIEINDVLSSEGGGNISHWSLQPIEKVSNDSVVAANNAQDMSKDKQTGMTVIELAHTALGLASSSSERGIPIDETHLNGIVLQAKKRLLKTGEQELRGRKASDAAFWFALAGISDNRSIGIDESSALDFSLFDALTFICLSELKRFGRKSSCQPIDIMRLVERIAASGVRSKNFVALQHEAARCLEEKDPKNIQPLVQRGVLATLYKGEFELHSERSLLCIWNFSTKQRKQRAFLKSAAKHWESKNQIMETADSGNASSMLKNSANFSIAWDAVFEDPTLPLVVDIGCGMGVSILGLSTMKIDRQLDNLMSNIDWNRCNFLGADLSRICINFASSIVKRWGLSDNVHFTVASAEDVMEVVSQTYPGNVNLCMIQFPTPFRFDGKALEEREGEIGLASEKHQGNMQLPTDAFSGFMVTKKLIESTYSALNNETGRLLLQSNCEDVAIYMNRLASNSGFDPLPSQKNVTKICDTEGEISQRTQKWIALGGERAESSIWNTATVLPSIRGATETEVACLLNKTPVHRVLLRPK